jgi:hypothetical protein
LTYTQVYSLPSPTELLRQGDVISNFVFPVPLAGDQQLVTDIFPFAVVVTPDCDIETHEKLTGEGKQGMYSYLLLPMMPREQVPASKWSSAKRNAQPSTQVLEACDKAFDSEAIGISGLFTEFRWLLAVSPEHLYENLRSGTSIRRTQICSPYREHMQQRLAAHLGRVALDRNHSTD